MGLPGGFGAGLVISLDAGFGAGFAPSFVDDFLGTFTTDFRAVLADAPVPDLSDDPLRHMEVLVLDAGGGDAIGTSAAGAGPGEVTTSRLVADAAGETGTLEHGAFSPGLTDFKRLTSGLPWRKRVSILFREDMLCSSSKSPWHN